MKTIKVTVDVQISDNENPQEIQSILDRYIFKADGLKEVDARLQKKDWSITQVTKKFITAK